MSGTVDYRLPYMGDIQQHSVLVKVSVVLNGYSWLTNVTVYRESYRYSFCGSYLQELSSHSMIGG